MLRLPHATAECEDSFMSSISDSMREDDETWEQSDGVESEEDPEELEWESSEGQVAERKFIVSESCLDLLLSKCAACNQLVSIHKQVKGCLLVATKTCLHCHETESWRSQSSVGGLAEGHLELSAAIMFSGSATAKFLRALKFAGVVCFNETTFYNVQKLYLTPAITSVWRTHQSALIEDLKTKGSPLVLGGDGRCCSPGHTAKYGTYSLMDLVSGKVLDIQLVQVRQLNIEQELICYVHFTVFSVIYRYHSQNN